MAGIGTARGDELRQRVVRDGVIIRATVSLSAAAGTPAFAASSSSVWAR